MRAVTPEQDRKLQAIIGKAQAAGGGPDAVEEAAREAGDLLDLDPLDLMEFVAVSVTGGYDLRDETDRPLTPED